MVDLGAAAAAGRAWNTRDGQARDGGLLVLLEEFVALVAALGLDVLHDAAKICGGLKVGEVAALGAALLLLMPEMAALGAALLLLMPEMAALGAALLMPEMAALGAALLMPEMAALGAAWMAKALAANWTRGRGPLAARATPRTRGSRARVRGW